MNHESSPTDLYVFRVFETPYQLVHLKLYETNLSYVKRFDPTYFLSVSKALEKVEDADQSKVAIRQLYAQELETLFSLLFAYLQAPSAIFAWVKLYRSDDLLKLVKNIQASGKISSEFRLADYSWTGIVDLLYRDISKKDHPVAKMFSKSLIGVYSQFASDFLNEEFRFEYNSIKHGLRCAVQAGGFSLGNGVQKMDFSPQDSGTKFYLEKPLSEKSHLKQNIQFVEVNNQWNLESTKYKICGLVKLLSGLKQIIVQHFEKNEELEVVVPSSEECEKIINDLPGHIVSTREYIGFEGIEKHLLTREEMLKRLNK